MLKPATVTALAAPTFLVSKLALVLLKAKLSPERRSLLSVTLAVVKLSYTLLATVLLITRSFCVMSAVVVALVLVRW